MAWSFETLGETTLLLARDGVPVLAADPWLSGPTCFSSRMRARSLPAAKLAAVARAPYVFISGGRAGRLHLPSLKLFSRGCDVLLPARETTLEDRLVAEGFTTRRLPFKRWVALASGLRVMCIDGPDGAVLAIDADGTLILDKGDAALCGEERFLRKLAKQYERIYLVALCAADDPGLDGPALLMTGRRPARDRLRAIHALARLGEQLGATDCCAQEPCRNVREEAEWADSWRIDWSELKAQWPDGAIRLVAPYAKVDLYHGLVALQRAPASGEASPIPADNWEEVLTATERERLENVASTLRPRPRLDFIAFNVGGETGKVFLRGRAQRIPASRQRGLVLTAPRRSLMAAIDSGRFPDLVGSHLLRAERVNIPRHLPLRFAPVSRAAWHDFRRSPQAFLRYRFEEWRRAVLVPFLGEAARWIGPLDTLRRIRSRADSAGF